MRYATYGHGKNWKVGTIAVLALVAGQEIEDSGMKLAMLTCMTRLLEAKCEELEGEGGTGRLERDQQLLEAAHQSEGLPSFQDMLPLWRSVLQRLFSGRPSLFHCQCLRDQNKLL